METSKSELISSAHRRDFPVTVPNKRWRTRTIQFFSYHGAILGVFTVALINGLWGLNSFSFSNDEHCTWWAVHLNWRDFLTLIKNIDGVLFPYYLFIRGWTTLFGDSEAVVRLPSVIATAIVVGLTVKIGQRIADPMTGFFAGLFLLAIPSTTYYAQTARPNAIAAATAIGVVCLFFRASDAPISRIRWFLYGLGIVITGLMHFVSLGVLAAQLPIVFALKRQFPWLVPNRVLVRNWALTVFLSLLALSPAFYFCAKQAGQLRDATITFKTLAFYISKLTLNGYVGGLLIVALVIAWVRQRQYRGILTFWALLPTILFFLTYDVLHIFRVRYFVFTLPAWALITAIAFSSNVNRSKWRYALPCGIFIAIVASSCSTEFYMRRRTTDRNCQDAPYKKIATILTKNAELGDAIIYSSSSTRQYHDRIGIAYAMRKYFMPNDILVERSAEVVGDFRARECRKIEKCIQNIPDRLWLLTRRTEDSRWGDIAPAKSEFISSQFREKKTWRVRQFNLVFFTKKLKSSQEPSEEFVRTSKEEQVAGELGEQLEE